MTPPPYGKPPPDRASVLGLWEPLLRALTSRATRPGPEAHAEMFRRLRHARSPKNRLALRNELVLANLGLAMTIGRRYRGQGLPFEDLVSEGVFGLIAAVDRFDPALGRRFGAYASPYIRGAIHRALDRNEAVLFPHEGVHAPLGERPTLAGPNHEALLEAREHLRALTALLEHVLGFVRALPSGAEAIVLHRFGLDGREPLTFGEIGELLGCSGQRVHQIELETFQRLERRCTGITPAVLIELERRLRELGAVLLTDPVTGDAGSPVAPASGGNTGFRADPPARRNTRWSDRPGWGYRLAPAAPRKPSPMTAWAMRELIASVLGDVPAAPRRKRSQRVSGDPAGRARRPAARSPSGGAAPAGPLGDELVQAVVLPRATLAELQREAVRLDRSLSSLVQLAWQLAGPALRKVASPNDFLPNSVAPVRPLPLR